MHTFLTETADRNQDGLRGASPAVLVWGGMGPVEGPGWEQGWQVGKVRGLIRTISLILQNDPTR